MTLQYKVVDEHGAQRLCLSGRLDTTNAGDLEKAMRALFLEHGQRVLVDFAELDYISSSGLRVFLIGAKCSKQSAGRLVLCGMTRNIRDVFEVSGFLRILDVTDDCASGLAQLAG